MECSAKPPSRSSSNISDIVSRFAKVCRFRSIGVFSSENPNNFPIQDFPSDGKNVPMAKDCSGGAEKADLDGSKIHPQPAEVCTKSNWEGHLMILKMFEILSELKLAYVQLQEAHIPYDPDKIMAADELIFTHFEGLCKIKRCFKGNQFQIPNSLSACSAFLLAEIEVQERLLEKLKAQIKKKSIEIAGLRGALRDLDSKNMEVVEEIKRRERDTVRSLNCSSIEDVVKAVSKSIHDFAKPLIALMKVSGWDLDKAANAVQDSVAYSVRSHKKYAFEAYISRIMFHGFSFRSYNVDHVLKFHEPVDALMDDPHGSFAKFCRKKYLLVVHPKMEASFFGNLDHRNLVSSGKHPRTPFYQLFVKMARWIWVLQGIVASVGAKAEMFVVKRGSEFSDVYMESIVEQKQAPGLSDEQREMFKVELMILPGFRIGETLIRSRVYLSKVANHIVQEARHVEVLDEQNLKLER